MDLKGEVVEVNTFDKIIDNQLYEIKGEQLLDDQNKLDHEKEFGSQTMSYNYESNFNQPVRQKTTNFEETEDILPDGTVITKSIENNQYFQNLTSNEWEMEVLKAMNSSTCIVDEPEETTEVSILFLI